MNDPWVRQATPTHEGPRCDHCGHRCAGSYTVTVQAGEPIKTLCDQCTLLTPIGPNCTACGRPMPVEPIVA